MEFNFACPARRRRLFFVTTASMAGQIRRSRSFMAEIIRAISPLRDVWCVQKYLTGTPRYVIRTPNMG